MPNLSRQRPVYGFEYVLAAQSHLVDKRTIVDGRRPQVVVHDRIENLGHDDNLAPGDVELFQGIAYDNL